MASSNLNYTVARIDLATARSGGTPIPEVGIGTTYDSVTVIQLPVAAVVEIAFGETGESKFFPLLIQGQAFTFKNADDCPLFVTEGLFVRNPVGVGTLILLIGFRSTGS